MNERPTTGVPQLVLLWSGREIPLRVRSPADESWFAGAVHLNLLQRDFEVHYYRGFTAVSALDRTDGDYAVMAKRGRFKTVPRFISHQSPGGGLDPDGRANEYMEVSAPCRPDALAGFRRFVDEFLTGDPGGPGRGVSR
jgi:hypothetical protein